MPRVNVKVESHFAQWATEAEKEITKAVDAAVATGAMAADAAEGPYQFKDTITPERAQRSGTAIIGTYGAHDWKARFFEKGTGAHSNVKGNRGSKSVNSLTKTGRKRRKAVGLVTGIKAERYMYKGVRAAKPVLLHELEIRLERIRVRVSGL